MFLADLITAIYCPDDMRRELAARATTRHLRPYVIMCSAPDGRSLYGYGGRTARYMYRWMARRTLRRLERQHAAANAGWIKPPFTFKIMYRCSDDAPRSRNYVL